MQKRDNRLAHSSRWNDAWAFENQPRGGGCGRARCVSQTQFIRDLLLTACALFPSPLTNLFSPRENAAESSLPAGYNFKIGGKVLNLQLNLS